MTAPTLLSAGDSTFNRLWTLDVNTTGNPLAPSWVTLQYVTEPNFNPDDAQLVDATVAGDGGWTGQDKSGAAWNAAFTVSRMIVPQSSPPAYDPAQEFLRTKAIGKSGAANRVHVRIYEYDVNDAAGVITPRVEAYQGFANVSWPNGGGGANDARTVAISLAGKGKLLIIGHPYPVTAPTVVPTIYTVSQTALSTAGSQLVRIFGSGFTGTVATTGVKFGGTNSPSWSVDSDGQISAVTPAHSAGSGLPVVVTNATGPSTTGPTVTYS